MFTDYIYQGEMHGDIAQTLGGLRFDSGLLRPWIAENGKKYVTINSGRKDGQGKPVFKNVRLEDLSALGIDCPVANATTMTRGSWIQLDTNIMTAARARLSAWNDLASRSRVGGFDAMAKLTYEYQAVSDPGEALVDMEGLVEDRADRPLQILRSLPLPIIHSGFYFSRRELAAARASGQPLDTAMGEACGRRVAEMAEQILIGTQAGITFGTQTTGYGTHSGTSTVYGYTTFPQRITKTDLTTPTGTNPEAIMTDILEMIELLQNNFFYGPYILYHSTPYSRYLNDDYFRSGSTSAVRTVRERLMQLEGISDIRRLDYLTSGYQLILVQMTSDVVQAIEGMPIQTVQWESMGGMRINFKVMAIMVPLFRSDYNGRTGIVHATTS